NLGSRDATHGRCIDGDLQPGLTAIKHKGGRKLLGGYVEIPLLLCSRGLLRQNRTGGQHRNQRRTQQQRRAEPAPCSAVTVVPDPTTPHRPAVSRTRKSQPYAFSERTKQPGFFSEKNARVFYGTEKFQDLQGDRGRSNDC